MDVGAVASEEAGYFVASWDSDGAAVEEHSALTVISRAASLFTMEDIYGYAVLDSGCTLSMTGLEQMTWLQDKLLEEIQEDPLAIDDTVKIRFTYANGTKGLSFGQVGIPHPLGLEARGGYLWFTMVKTPSPTLLGLDYMEAAGCWQEHGELVYYDSYREPLVRLRSGHWGLPPI